MFVWSVCVVIATAADKASGHPAVNVDSGAKIQAVNDSQGNNTNNNTLNNTSLTTPPTSSTSTTSTTPQGDQKEVKDLPVKGAAEEEHQSSLTIFFITIVVGISILVVHLLIQTRFHYLPESIAIVLIGAFIGMILKIFKFGNWKNEEAFSPTVFFIVLLPPIIFESGYNLHKGNFFHNIGSILVFAVFGTAISALVVGGGVYLLGQAEVAYKLSMIESFAFGSLISAVDPVATLAIFQALDVDPILYMLVFGESVLNDAVSIVLTTTILEFSQPDAASGASAFFLAVGRFCVMFFASSAIGVLFGLVSAMLLKFVDLHKTPSLEFGLVLMFSYLPYALAEGIHLSGIMAILFCIMAILFCGITMSHYPHLNLSLPTPFLCIMAILFCGIAMSHYTHFNLSPVTQITVQQTFRTMAFICETCVFAYLGMAIFSFKVNVKPAFCIWSIILLLLGRAANIFPLSFILNFFREHKITRKNQFIMWFSGLRGAIAFALSLHLELMPEKRYVLVTATLIIVLFTMLVLGGSTMPLLKLMNNSSDKRKKKKHKKEVSMSKTKELGETVDSEHLSELTEEEYEVNFVKPNLKGFLKLDAKYLVPFFTRRFTQQEVREGRSKVDSLTMKWYKEVRAAPSESEDEEDSSTNVLQMEETCLVTPSQQQ
ncbi:hypothetical protein ACOMHN_059330 [Nucella lapillus]